MMVRSGRLEEVETPQRLASHQRYVEAGKRRQAEKSLFGEEVSREAFNSITEERIIGDRDFLGVEFLEMAAAVARFVGRVRICSRAGQVIGFGTGFMVSPRLLLTNNHVLSTLDTALESEVEFDYQNDLYWLLNLIREK